MVTRFRHDPKVRANGRCVVCREPRDAQRSRRYGKAEAEIDPFCSAECCRQWYGVALVTDQRRVSRASV